MVTFGVGDGLEDAHREAFAMGSEELFLELYEGGKVTYRRYDVISSILYFTIKGLFFFKTPKLLDEIKSPCISFFIIVKDCSRRLSQGHQEMLFFVTKEKNHARERL